jgi:hypothetical protein
MAQGFTCFCGAATCRGFISGAKNMTSAQLEGVWLNAHIRALLEERDGIVAPISALSVAGNGTEDETEEALKIALVQARKMVDVAQRALDTYTSIHGRNSQDTAEIGRKGANRQNGVGSRELNGEMGGDTHRGVTSRELGGEMGGDTLSKA